MKTKTEPFCFEAASVELFRRLAARADTDSRRPAPEAADGRRPDALPDARGRDRRLPVVAPVALSLLNPRKFQGA